MSTVAELVDRDGPWCHYCGGLVLPWKNPDVPWYQVATVDHRTPRIRGGSNEPRNLVVACARCNSAKGTRPYLDFIFARWALEPA